MSYWIGKNNWLGRLRYQYYLHRGWIVGRDMYARGRKIPFSPLERLRMRLTGYLPCECHWQLPYGYVVMAGCRKHD